MPRQACCRGIGIPVGAFGGLDGPGCIRADQLSVDAVPDTGWSSTYGRRGRPYVEMETAP